MTENRPIGPRTTTVSADDFEELRNRVEDLLDYVHGTNVRPTLTKRTSGDYPAEVRPNNLTD